MSVAISILSFVFYFTLSPKFHVLVVEYSLKIAPDIVKPFGFNG